MTIDGGLRSIFRERLKAGFHWQSVETGGTGRGVPDSNYCCGGVEGWIEFKQTSAFRLGMRIEQVAWLMQRASRGGRVYIAARRKHDGGERKGPPVDQLWIIRGSEARAIVDKGLVDPVPGHLGMWDGGPSRWNWDEVRQILVG